MANGISIRGKKVWFQMGTGTERIRKPLAGEPTTKTNIAHLERSAGAIKARWHAGENLADLFNEWRGEPTEIKTLGDYAQHYLDFVLPLRKAARATTVRNAENTYNQHWIKFDQYPITKLPILDMEAHLLIKDLGPSRLRAVMSNLRQILQLAVDDRTLDRNPIWPAFSGKDNGEEYDPNPYSKEQRDTLLAWMKDHNDIAYRFFLMCFYTGMRTGEALAVKYENYEQPFMTVKQQITDRQLCDYTKTGPARQVPIPAIVHAMFMKKPVVRSLEGFIHTARTGRMFLNSTYLLTHWEKAHKATGIALRTGQKYPWRSTYISQNISAGVNIEDIARWSGNSAPTIRKHYYKYLPDADRDAMKVEMLEAALQ